MKQKITYGQMMNYAMQIQQLKQSGSVFYFAFQSRWNEFHNIYSNRISSTGNELKILRLKYFEHDEKGNPIEEEYQPNPDSEKKAKRWKLNPDMKLEDYNKETENIMSREILS